MTQFSLPAFSPDALLQDFRDGAGAHGVAAFANRKPQALLQRHRSDQAHFAAHVVSRHHHLHPLRQLHVPRHVRRPKVKLRPVSREKRRVPPAFFLRQHVRFRLELRVRCNASRLAHHLPPLHVFLLRPPQQQSHVVPRPPLVQLLPEHLHPPPHFLLCRPETHDLHFLPHLHLAALHSSRHPPPAPRNRKYIFDRHGERLIHIAHRQG